MKLNPKFYTKLIRPKFAIKLYIERILSKKFNLKKGTVLDFGCGTGTNSYMFDPSDYLGVDVDEGRVSYAKKTYPKYNFDLLKDCKIPADDNKFNTVCILATIHHIPDEIFKLYIPEFKRVLKQGGKIISIEPCLFKNNWFRNWFMRFFDEGNYIRSEQDYKKLFEGAFDIKIHKKFRKFFLYNEIFFSANKI